MIAPTLFVGLGGTGSRLVAQLEEKNRNSGERIGYVVFDTDANELRALKRKGFTGQVIQTSANMTVGEYLDEDKVATEEWFPVHKILNRKSLTEGAGQVRSISRLALNATISSGGMEPLHKAIEDLYRLDGDPMKQSLRVVIISSLVGGTGSGILLPVGLYIRNYLISTYQQYSAIIRGFFIMPEVFDKVNSDPSERSSLMSNCYATLRELDAFMRKGDGALEERYVNRLKFEVPVAGTDTYQNLNVMPYDFCFLFDKRASDNSILDSFQDYMEQAVDSVHAISVGLTSKRNNSSEDNIIKELCRAKDIGRSNRYCGVGSSTLIYPYKDIRDFISIGWANDVLGEEWLEIDKAYKRAKEDEKEKKKTVLITKELTRSEHYIQFVEETNQNPMVNRIKECCQCNSEEEPGSWLDYLDAIKTHIAVDVIPKQQEVAAAKNACEGAIEFVENKPENATKSNVTDIKLKFDDYKAKAYAEAARKADAVCYDLFQSSGRKTDDFYLEHWLKTDGNNGFHPLATRYFLYKAIAEMANEAAHAGKMLEDVEEFFKKDGAFESEIFDDPKTKKQQEDRDQAHAAVENKYGIGKKKRAKEVQVRFGDGYKNGIEKVEEYRLYYIYKEALEKGQEYLEGLALQYEKFFDNFGDCIKSMVTGRDVILSKYKNIKGKTKRYVCTSDKCLNKLAKSATNFNSATDVPADLCDCIYNDLRGIAMKSFYNNGSDDEDEGVAKRYYQKIFDETIMKFWKESVEESYGQILDKDIIDALLMEAEFEGGYLELDEQIRYAENVFEEMEKLSTPFITRPVGSDRRTIKSCAYPRVLNKKEGKVGDLVKAYLKDKGGETDPEDAVKPSVSRYEISFTLANYGLKLVDFGKFAPKKDSPTYPEDRQAGSYFTSYYDLVNHIHPNPLKTTRINPHLDRNWHYITSLPELDPDEQDKIENRICTALIYGLIMGKFKYERRTVYADRYKYVLTFKEKNEMHELVVDDDMCDCFYELLTALVKNAMVVEKILDDTDREIKKNINSLRKLSDSIVIRRLKKFKIDEVDAMYDADHKAPVRSIFEVPLIYTRTVPVSDFDGTFANRMIEMAMKILEDTVRIYVKEDDVDFIFGRLMVQQLELFRKNLEDLGKIWIGIDKEAIVTNINLTISEKLYDLGLDEASEWAKGTLSDEEYKEYREKNGIDFDIFD